MPTSSQSLILQMTNGQLPPVFGRRHWKPEVPPGPEWNVAEYPMSTVQIKDNFTEYGNKRQKFRRKPQPFQRTGSAPELSSSVDFTTLPQVLRIRGLHGSLRYDMDAASVQWKVNTIGPFYDRLNNRRTGLVNKSTPAKLKLFHADRENHSVQDRAIDTPHEYGYQPDFRRQAMDMPHEYGYQPDFRRQAMDIPHEYGYQPDLRRQAMDIPHKHGYQPDFRRQAMDIPHEYGYQPDLRRQVRFHETMNTVFMSLWQVNGEAQLIKADLETADYFKLIKVNRDVEEGSGDSHAKIPLFRLEKCSPTDAGCFRVAPTEGREVGDFKLVPPPGYIADDFRLVPSSEVHGAFVLLQSDASHVGQFRPVQCNKETSDEFHMVQAKIKDNSTDQYKMDVIIPSEAWGYSDHCPEYYDGYGTLDRSKNKSIPNMTFKASENRYSYFDDVREVNGPIENEYSLPDISLHQTLRQGAFHQKRPAFQDLDRESTSDNDLREFNEHLENFNKRYFETLQASSSAEKRFVYHGNRNSKNVSDDDSRAAENKESSSFKSSDWRTHNFDQWSRIPRVESSSSALPGLPGSRKYTSTVDNSVPGNLRKMPSVNQEENVNTEEQDALLDEVKFRASYKQWKKKKVATLRMRRELPPEDPTAVCVRFGDSSLSHNELKSKIENETGYDVVSLQFDPVSVHAFDSDPASRWIIKFKNVSICETLVVTGLRLSGVKYQVRKFDEVMKEEHEAYKLYQTMRKITERRPRKPSVLSKTTQKPRQLKTTQTQTNKEE